MPRAVRYREPQPRGHKQKAILAMLREDPTTTNDQMRDAVPGLSTRYISDIRREYGYPVYLAFDGPNRWWLIREAKRLQTGPQFVLNALVTDARLG